MIKYQQEFLFNVESECQELIKLHWKEVATNKEVIKLNPDWEAYQNLEGSGNLKIFTARDEGTLVGYFVVIVGRSLHHKDHIFAENDMVFLHPDYRKGFTGIHLIKFVENCLKDDGVSLIKINTKVHQPFDLILNRLSYDNTERVYTKLLGD